MQWSQVKGTVLLSPHNEEQEKNALLQAAGLIKAGELVAFPTETVYGLGADALNPASIAKIFEAKGRPADNPLIVHVDGIEQAAGLVAEIPREAVTLARYFWPGPLTIVLPKKSLVPDIVTAGLSSVALRVPSHPIALKLLRAAGRPIAAPSANISGSPSPTTAAHVLADLAGSFAAILDGGACSVGLESTVVSLLSSPPVLLRPGWVTREMLEKTLKASILDISSMDISEKPETPVLSPGMKYRHYAPRAPLFLVEAKGAELCRQLLALSEGFIMQRRKPGLILSSESAVHVPSSSPAIIEVLGARDDLTAVGQRLFYALRKMDLHQVDVIIAEGFDETGLGIAVMNRLRKAATQIIKN